MLPCAPNLSSQSYASIYYIVKKIMIHALMHVEASTPVPGAIWV